MPPDKIATDNTSHLAVVNNTIKSMIYTERKITGLIFPTIKANRADELLQQLAVGYGEP